MMIKKVSFCCFSLDESTHVHVIHEFTDEILEQLTGETKRILDDDLVLSHMLLLEFGTHPCNIPALIQLCYLVCDFFAPLLNSSGEALPANLLQFRYNKLLTQRLHAYNNDKKSKVYRNCLFLF
jgi:hypothetical protein